MVDDQKTIREAIKLMVAPAQDIEVIGTAKNGYEAIEKVNLLHPDLVLLDLEMPGLDGITTTKILCENFRGIKVLVLSMHHQEDYVNKSLQAGAIGYLLKNILEEDLREAIRFVYRGYAHLGPGLLSQIMSGAEAPPKNALVASPRDISRRPVEDHPQNALAAAPREIGWQQVLILLIAAVSLSLGIYLLRQFLREPLPSLSSLQQAASVMDTEFTGKIKPASTFKIAAVAPSLVERIYVKLGQRVKAGQVLLSVKNLEAQKAIEQQQQLQQATLQQQQIAQQQRQTAQEQIAFLERQIVDLKNKSTPLNTEVATAQMRLANLQSQMDSLPLPQRQFSVERTQAVYKRALSRVQSYKDLQDDGAIAKDQVEQAQADLKVAQADFEVAKEAAKKVAQLEQAKQKQSRLQRQVNLQEQQEKLQQLEGQLKTTRLDHNQATERLKQLQRQASQSLKQPLPQLNTSIPSTRDGVVIELPITEGDQLFTGNTLIGLAELSYLHVEVGINARLINAVHLGQSIAVKVGSGKNAQKFKGKIVLINPLPNQELNHLVEIQFKNPTHALLVGQLATVQFLSQ